MTPEELKHIRENILKLKQKELAELMGYKGHKSISKYEQPGARIPGGGNP